MIEDVVRAWHQLIRGEVEGDRDAFLTQLLAEDVVFYSPVVFTPQKGRDITKLYLQAAAATFDPARYRLAMSSSAFGVVIVAHSSGQTSQRFRRIQT